MSRFAALDLKALAVPSSVVALDYDAILAARLAELEARLATQFDAAKVAETMAVARKIAASPLRYLNEAAAARELYVCNRLNEAVRSVFLATARGGDLDQIGAGRGVVRKVLSGADSDSPVLEDDEAFRARIQLVVEAWSPHGTEGSYVYWALDADDRVLDVVPYGPNDPIDPPIPSAEPVLVVLSSEGDGTADPALLDKVYKNCIPDKRRPIGDKLSVSSADIVSYTIQARLHVQAPDSSSDILKQAQASAAAFVNNRIRIGRKLFRTSIASALQVSGVVDVELISPAADLDMGPFEAPHCADIQLELVQISERWRDV